MHEWEAASSSRHKETIDFALPVVCEVLMMGTASFKDLIGRLFQGQANPDFAVPKGSLRWHGFPCQAL